MNSSLERIKQKMMIKPPANEREPVAVIINANTTEDKILFIDQRNKDFNREKLLNILEDNNVFKVVIKPALRASLRDSSSEIRIVPNKNPKKKYKKVQFKDKDSFISLEPEEREPDFTNIPMPKQDEEEEEEEGQQNDTDDESNKIGEKTIGEKTIKKTRKRTLSNLNPNFEEKFGLAERVNQPTDFIQIKASKYYMNNREMFINFINSLFRPYKEEIEQSSKNVTCETLDKEQNDFSLLTHQKIVRDYINLYTPYRGLLLYHGLGSGKTCTSIAIAEGMKHAKKIMVLTPASLRRNYMEQLKFCGDSIYKKNQFWEFISLKEYPDALPMLSSILNLPERIITNRGGAWFINVSKSSNYAELNVSQKEDLEKQLDMMIKEKYEFVNYNGLSLEKLKTMTSDFTKNLFDDKVVIVDEAHNLISRIVNKIKKRKALKKGTTIKPIISLSIKLYDFLISASNAKIILLTGTPIINYPNEFGILFNILRGYIKTWEIPLTINTSKKIDQNAIERILSAEKVVDYISYSASKKTLIVTRNPFGFQNMFENNKLDPNDYAGVSKQKKNADKHYISDNSFIENIIKLLNENDIDVPDKRNIKVTNYKALPDDFDTFENAYIDNATKELKNMDNLKRRIIGLSSFFKSAKEDLLPTYENDPKKDYHLVKIPMSNFQFKEYESARKRERKTEKTKKSKGLMNEVFGDSNSTYKIFSRLFCNFVMEDRPIPMKIKDKDKDKDNDLDNDLNEDLDKDNGLEDNLDDLEDQHIPEGETEGDVILENVGGKTYKEMIDKKILEIKENAEEYLTPEKLQIYSPKFLQMLINITNKEYKGLHLVYSQFRTLEGIELFSMMLNQNGFARFKVKRSAANVWKLDIPSEDKGKPMYVLYTGTESSDEKEIYRNVYNGDWKYVPESIANKLLKKSQTNKLGEIIKVFMITSSGSEGINLKNTRYVHIMEPYWHPVRLEQVIGRARRICSHKDLPKSLQTVEVFVYIMVFSQQQLDNKNDNVELLIKDISKFSKKPITTDEYLYEISEIKAKLTRQLTDIIKESAFDCNIYNNGKCMSFANPTNKDFSYVPDFEQQQSDVIMQVNKRKVKWTGREVNVLGKKYVVNTTEIKDKSNKFLKVYDYDSYMNAVKNNDMNGVIQVGTLENVNGEWKNFQPIAK